MTFEQFMIVYVSCLVCMLLCRCVPIFFLKGRELPENLQAALNLIPPAAFAALVANDLLKPDMFAAGFAAGMVPLLSAAIVVLVARKTHSLIWCAITGFVAYAALSMLL